MKSSNLILFGAIKSCLSKFESLPPITYKKTKIIYSSINAFRPSTKDRNDYSNNMRECIICVMINGKIDKRYFQYSRRWKRLHDEIKRYIEKVVVELAPSIKKIGHISCEKKGGRKFNYDFELTINKTITFKIEFKFNAKCVFDCPQFLSLSHPSNL